MIKATKWLGEQYQKSGMTPNRINLLVSYAGHSMQHVRKSAKHAIQKNAAETMRDILIH